MKIPFAFRMETNVMFPWYIIKVRDKGTIVGTAETVPIILDQSYQTVRHGEMATLKSSPLKVGENFKWVNGVTYIVTKNKTFRGNAEQPGLVDFEAHPVEDSWIFVIS